MSRTVTNLHTNPSVEGTTLTVWERVAASTTVSRVAANPAVGTYSLSVTCPGSGADEGIWPRAAMGSTTGQTRTFISSISLAGSGTMRLWTRAQYSSGQTDSAVQVITLTGTHTRYVTAPVTIDPAKALTNIRCVVVTNVASAASFHADALLIMEGSSIMPYFDGDTAGAAWTGTAHTSTSVKTFADTSLAMSRVFSFGERIGPLRVGKG